MKYFIAQANKDYYQIQIKNWYNTMNPRLVSEGRYDEIPESLTFKIEPNERAFRTDIISFPYFMITEEAKEILTLCDSSFRYCKINLFDTKNQTSKQYLLPFLQYVDCLTEETEYNKNKSDVIRPVISLKKAGNRLLFRPKGFSQQTAAIHLELAESLLRSKIRGLGLTEIEVVD